MRSQARLAPLPPVQLPRDERPHQRGIEWWHFMGHFRKLHSAVRVPACGPDHPTAPSSEAAPVGETYTFVLTVLKARVQGFSKLASFAILVDHARETHTVSTQVGALGTVCFEPEDGSALNFHFGPRGPSRPGPPEAWSVRGGMGFYQVDIDTSLQLSMSLAQRNAAVLVGWDQTGSEHTKVDGIMRYADDDEMGYYAFPALSLDGVMGTGRDERPIVGRAWMEHQWGDFPLGDYKWKYLAINMRRENVGTNEQLLLFRAVKGNSKNEIGHGLWIHANGESSPVEVNSRTVADTRDRFNGYPLETIINIPKQSISLTIKPLFRDQECRTELPRSLFPTFWEGACCVNGNIGGDKVDSAYSWAVTELAGYP